MKYTEEAKQALSRRVAEKFNIAMYRFVGIDLDPLWLHDDWHEIMELCVKHGVSAEHDWDMKIEYADSEIYKFAVAIQSDIGIKTQRKVHYDDHNNDPSLAERVARMLALLEVQP